MTRTLRLPPDDQPIDLVHERWRERAKAQEADPVKLKELGIALGQARRDLPYQSDSDTIHSEQLLPP